MKRTLIKEIFKDFQKLDKQEMFICGWIRTIRDNGNFAFIELNDGSTLKSIQLVLDNNDNNNYNYDEIVKQNIPASVEVKGIIVLTPENKQPFEMKVKEIKVEGKSLPEYPLQKKRHSMEFLREMSHLRARTNTFNATFRVRSEAAFAIHKFFNERGFVYVHTPIITGSDCEGAGEMFRVTTFDLENSKEKYEAKNDFFGKRAGLTVSGQLAVEPFAEAFGKVYTFGPTFRAENSNTTRHAAEFWMIEPEIAFADLNDDMDLAQEMIQFIIKHVLKTCSNEIDFFDSFIEKGLRQKLETLATSPFKRITYTEAIDILKKNNDNFQYKVEWGVDIQTEHERYLTEKVFNMPVFVTDYPKEIKAFYMRVNDDNKTVRAFDMLVPGVGELIGGSQREERIDVLKNRMKECGLNEEDYQFYLDIRKYGGTIHSGYGLGFERLLMYLTGMGNIRDVIPYPRTVGNLEF